MGPQQVADGGEGSGPRSTALYAAIAVALVIVLLFMPDIIDWLNRRR